MPHSQSSEDLDRSSERDSPSGTHINTPSEQMESMETERVRFYVYLLSICLCGCVSLPSVVSSVMYVL